MLPDTLAIANYYMDAFNWGGGCGRYIAWGVFDDPSFEMPNRYLPSASWTRTSTFRGGGVQDHGVRRPFLVQRFRHVPVSYFVTEPEYTEYDVNDRYTWLKPLLTMASHGGRLLLPSARGVPSRCGLVVDQIDGLLETLGVPGNLGILQSTLGRPAPARSRRSMWRSS